jgi:hypothetical protein
MVAFRGLLEVPRGPDGGTNPVSSLDFARIPTS